MSSKKRESDVKKIDKKNKIIEMKGLLLNRKINLISMNLFILLILPYYLDKLGFKNDFWSIAILGIYLFMFFGFWFFVYFLYKEISYTIKFKINFFSHIYKNPLVLCGIIPFLVYAFLSFLVSI